MGPCPSCFTGSIFTHLEFCDHTHDYGLHLTPNLQQGVFPTFQHTSNFHCNLTCHLIFPSQSKKKDHCHNLDVGVLRRFQYCTGHITTGSKKGRGNQYIQLVKVLYCKLPTNGKQLPAFPLEVEP